MTNFSTAQHTVDDGVLRLAITGEVDLATADLLTDAITNVITGGHVAELIIDLDEVTFLDASGISSLIRGRNLAAAFDIAYHVANAHDMVHRVLDITGVLGRLAERLEPSWLP
jgi:anti-sigma B factor antagonist